MKGAEVDGFDASRIGGHPMQPHDEGQTLLEAFLSRTSLPEKALSYGELQGFLFALACAPDLVKPSEWLPVIFGGDPPGFDTEAEAQKVVSALMTAYNDALQDVQSSAAKAASACPFHDDVLANLEPDAPVAQWARGFRVGHLWLEETWEEYLLEEWEEELGAQIATLAFFSSRELAEAIAADVEGPDSSLEAVATTFRKLFPDAVRGYAAMGTAMWKARLEMEQGWSPRATAPPPPGRNQPCPCGSGRKFKKCCGRPVH